ncbi:MAG: tRNA (adenosine(37)-N6)-dimethylallyltransferase MiaA [Candidatus Nanopelagicales bacterium]
MVAVVGPTGTGKSDLGVALARALDGEVVNADSMQVYQGMDVGTAKLTEAERGGVPHHLLDVWLVRHAVSVAEYQALARATVDDVLARGRVPLLVGGSGLYVGAVVDDLRFPGTDAEVRARWEAELDRLGPQALHDLLAERDPDAAAAILPTNGRRIVRALEVVELTGSFRARLPEPTPWYRAVHVGLTLPRPELDVRLAQRVDRMWAAGLVDEVRRLADTEGLRDAPTASRALGYRQVLAFLAGECDEATAREETVRATRAFARRQERWFRRDPRVVWLPADAPDLVERALATVRARGAPVTA